MRSAYNTAGIDNPKPETVSVFNTENACSSTNKTFPSVTIDSSVLLSATHHSPFTHAYFNPAQQPPLFELTTPSPTQKTPHQSKYSAP